MAQTLEEEAFQSLEKLLSKFFKTSVSHLKQSAVNSKITM
jgi:hypothetical protein